MLRTVLQGLLGLVGCLLACELLLRLLPVSTATATGYYTDPLVLSYPPGHAWTTSTGWALQNAQRLRSNNAGFLAHRDFVPEPRAVVLIGDSFVEAAMLPAGERPGEQLERALSGRPVYTMGAPGSALLDYAERIRLAQSRYGVRDMVLLMERGDVRQSLCGSGQIHGPCLERQSLAPRSLLQPPPGAMKRLLRRSALAQYLMVQLKFDPQRFWRQALAGSHATVRLEAGLPASAMPAPPAALDAVSAAFFERIRGRVAGRLVIVVDSDRAAIRRGSALADPDRARFIAQARAAGATVVDTEPLYRAQLARSPLALEVGPQDAHLNTLGVALVMQAAARALQAP
ncbi:MAG TPA: hypothetical protein VLA16_23360 [Ideonella sp.]|nr:hypothetical protein [Ideonella sp.]